MGLFSRSDGAGAKTGFDRVSLAGATGEEKILTRSEFEVLPLDQRVRAILSKRLKFFRDGKEVPMREALGDRY